MTKNVINIKTGEPIKAFRRKRNKVSVPELETKEDIQNILSFLRDISPNISELVVFGKRSDGSYFEDIGTSSTETLAVATKFFDNNIRFE